MFNLNLFKNIGVPLYLFIYLIIPNSAITKTLKVDFIRNLENSLNSRNLDFIRKNFKNDENQNIRRQFSKIINDFPDSKWKIKRLKSNVPNKEILRIKVLGEKIDKIPDGLYPGEYLKETAKVLVERDGNKWCKLKEEIWLPNWLVWTRKPSMRWRQQVN